MSLVASNIVKMTTSHAVSNENFDQKYIVSIPMVYANLCDTIFLVICQESFCTRNHGNKIMKYKVIVILHDDVFKWKHFPSYWPFVCGIHRSPVNSLQEGQWRGALMFSLICVWINGRVNNPEVGDLRRYRAHYDVTVMIRLLLHLKGHNMERPLSKNAKNATKKWLTDTVIKKSIHKNTMYRKRQVLQI